MARRRSIERERILDAVEAVIAEHGPQALTLDLVAACAKISKGGLTYSFGTKEALLAALLERDAARFKARLEYLAVRHKGAAHPEIVGLIESWRSGASPIRPKTANLLAALMHAPGAIEPVRSLLSWIFARFATNSPADRQARLVFMALLGVFFAQGLGLVEMPSKTRIALLEDLKHVLLYKAR